MKKILPACLRSILFSVALVLMSLSSRANHIVGADMFYTWVSGNQYKVTVILYGDCGAPSAVPFASLPCSYPQVCVYNGATLLSTLTCSADAVSAAGGTEITPVCADSIGHTQCTITSSTTPGIKKFSYSATYTFTGTSSVFRFVYTGNNTPPFPSTCPPGVGIASSGRALAITNVSSTPAVTTIQLIDTLNNTIGHNTSPILTVVPTPFFASGIPNCYTPGAIDPDADSLSFDLISATNGTGSCTVGGPVTYIGTAWPGQPITAATPLQTNPPPAYNFDGTTGQICFNSLAQRSVVVFNIREYRGGVFVGSSQREMTFLVQNFPYFPPSPGAPTTSGTLTPDVVGDTSHFHTCGGKGPFAFTLHPTESNPANHITCSASGIGTSGLTFSVINNNTNAPICTISGNSSTMLPGIYNFFITLRDDGCPITSSTVIPYRIQIYPVPTISVSNTANADCVHGAVVTITPGGTGSPWLIKTIDSSLIAGGPGIDTIQSHTDSAAYTDTLNPGVYYFWIYTNVTNQCSTQDSIKFTAPPRLQPIITFTNPTFCGKDDGQIIITNLNAGGLDTVTYNYGATTGSQAIVVNSAGQIILGGLRAGTYSNIVVHYGYCTSIVQPAQTLIDPPFIHRTITESDATKCGFCNGFVKIWGMHPGQLDTIAYTYTNPASLTVADTVAFYVGPDSSMVLSGLCKGGYNSFVIYTAGTATSNNCVWNALPFVETVNAPSIIPKFDSLTHLGCHGDTMVFTNLSTPASDLFYSWQFGDGTTSNLTNPVHVYTNTNSSTYTIKLFISNTKCLDSIKADRTFNNFQNPQFSMDPPSFLCQALDTLKFTNSSAASAPSYTWFFGDGSSDVSTNPTHTYPKVGTYKVMFVEQNVLPVIPPDPPRSCYDTLYKTITVDSNTAISMLATDSVLCRGQSATFTGIYAHGGDVSNAWAFGDGFNMNNVNNVMHAFEGVGTFTVSVNAAFRACPAQSVTRSFTVFDYPSIYIGPDMTICPGSNPIQLTDSRNTENPKATWMWNTNETTPGITVTKPGQYVASVTIDGCTTSDTISVIKDCYMEIPNVFTPNGDGVNDYFFPRKFLTKGVITFKMNIYNRWGQLIYETATTDGQGWDGALNNVPQPGGVYIYAIDATYKDGQIEHHTGNITLLR